MSASAVLSEAAILIAGMTSAATLYYGWRKRIADAARAPFLVGESAIADAKAALEFRGRLIEELQESEATLKAQLKQALATADVQSGELTKVQARLYTVEGENRELLVRAESAETALHSARSRLTDLEEKWEALQRKLSLGPDGTY